MLKWKCDVHPRMRGYIGVSRNGLQAVTGATSRLNALNAGELDLLVGTQMIAKGHDVHGVTLVGVVGADMALGMPDFRAAIPG